jgi:hypothetical protein
MRGEGGGENILTALTGRREGGRGTGEGIVAQRMAELGYRKPKLSTLKRPAVTAGGEGEGGGRAVGTGGGREGAGPEEGMGHSGGGGREGGEGGGSDYTRPNFARTQHRELPGSSSTSYSASSPSSLPTKTYSAPRTKEGTTPSWLRETEGKVEGGWKGRPSWGSRHEREREGEGEGEKEGGER